MSKVCNLVDLIYKLLTSYLIEKDIPTILDCVTDDINWIGSSPEEIAMGKENLQEVLSKTINETWDYFEYELKDVKEKVISDKLSYVSALLNIKHKKDEISPVDIKVVVACRNDENGFLISSMNASFTSNALKTLTAESVLLNQQIKLYNNSLFTGFSILKNEAPFEIIYVSDTFLSIHEATKETLQETCDNKAINYVHPDDRNNLLNEGIIKHNENYFSRNFRIITAKGNIKYLRSFGSKGLLNGEKVLYIIDTDITHEKVIEAKLKEDKALIEKRYSDTTVSYTHLRRRRCRYGCAIAR